ncbi:diaminopimelate decarboxylase [Ectothiorhodospiraceae bacterium BW-2]|nr:diaminopimelate decarboxylase [Ectothiorhodospiraceae bacterium BW-2]
MDHFHYQENQLFCEQVALSEIAATYGTPCYLYSRATIERHWQAFDSALASIPHQICYAVKANSNLAILNLLARLGSGFDIVSIGELERVVAAGGDPAKVIFSGVGKRVDEIERALELGIHCFNIESLPELARITTIAAAHGQRAPVSLRVNPDVDANTHPYISTGLKENKFGIALPQSLPIYQQMAQSPWLEVIGVDCHIGSQLTEVAPFVAALDRVLALVEALSEVGIKLRHIDMGGGLGIRYRDETPPLPEEYALPLLQRLKGWELELLLEPGRAIVGNAGVLLTRVEYLKPQADKQFAIVDAAMNDLLRPSLYQAWQRVEPVMIRQGEAVSYDIVGPVCETGDFLAKERSLVLQPGDLLVVRSAGAYGFSMSSNYNSRARVAEVMVDGAQSHLIRQREPIGQLYRGESLLPGV